MATKIKINELRRIVEQVINETPFDDIDFGFMDKEDEEKNNLKNKASEEFYNNMVKDVDVLRQVYKSMLDTQDKEKAKSNFKNSQMMNRVENYMEDLYKNDEYRKLVGDQALLKVCDTTFDKFFDNAYDAAIKRHNR